MIFNQWKSSWFNDKFNDKYKVLQEDFEYKEGFSYWTCMNKEGKREKKFIDLVERPKGTKSIPFLEDFDPFSEDISTCHDDDDYIYCESKYTKR